MIKRRSISSMLVFIMLLTLMSIPTFATANTTFKADNVIAEAGSEVNVPITISNNQGIIASKISVSYDSRLTLTKVEKGTALSALVMTPPGNLTMNPFNLLWDGMEGDATNGTVAVLTFTVPEEAGTYPITLSAGKTYSTDEQSLDIVTQNGSITVEGQITSQTPTISVGTVSGKVGDTVTVPVTISNNPGILGAIITFTYDSSLTLVGATNGEAFSHLTMTTPGQFVSPCNFLWDGQDMTTSDIKDGAIINLQFKISDTASAGDVYNISASYKKNHIFDMNFDSVDVALTDGNINIKTSNAIELTVAGEKVIIENENNDTGVIFIAFYDSRGVLLSLSQYNSDEQGINVPNTNDKSKYAKVMFWEKTSTLRPISTSEIVTIK